LQIINTLAWLSGPARSRGPEPYAFWPARALIGVPAGSIWWPCRSRSGRAWRSALAMESRPNPAAPPPVSWLGGPAQTAPAGSTAAACRLRRTGRPSRGGMLAGAAAPKDRTSREQVSNLHPPSLPGLSQLRWASRASR